MNKLEFVNPYNFIPLGKERADAGTDSGRLTGVIEYSVYTKTPLFIPNTSNDKALKVKPENGKTVDPEHKSYDFFSYADLSDQSKTYEKEYHMPVIPGSEIRGMLRNNYEILTNSCMSALDSDTVLSKRTAQVFEPALIKKNRNGTYDLYRAKDYLWRTKGAYDQTDELNWKDGYYTRKCYRQKEDLLPEGCRVYFRAVKRDRGKPLACEISLEERRGAKLGYIIKGEDGPEMRAKGEKHCCHIFEPQNKYLTDISLEALDTVLVAYKNNDAHEYAEYKRQLERFKGCEEGFFPVYYSKPTDYLMLSPASITREVYKNKLKDIARSFHPCTDKKNLCPACALFGTIGDGFAVSSRIRFSDLTCRHTGNAKDCYMEPVTLQPLSTPKLNNMEFYLKRPEDAWFWTYDYYITPAGEVRSYLPEINGRKFYWHQMNVKLPKNVEPTKLNMTVRPVKEKVTFSGRLYFKNLTEKELNQLLWLLNAGDNNSLEQKGHGYKLGAAKPLGLGSIAVSVEEVRLRKLIADKENRTVRMEEDLSFGIRRTEDGLDKEVLKNFEKMTSFQAVAGERISYPIKYGKKSQEENNGYEWFVANHKGYIREKKRPVRMPNRRLDMYFAEHMKAMEPGLEEVMNPDSLQGFGYGNQGGNKGKEKKNVPNGNFKPGNKQNTRKKQEVLAAKIKKVENNGNLTIDVKGQEGCVRKQEIPGMRALSMKAGDHIKVVFLKEEVLKKGKKVRNYKLAD